MKRREFIGTLLGVASVALPAFAQAQQRQRVRRVGVLLLSFPKIISGRIDDAIRPRSEWRQ